jgi:hypothetical protein
METDFIFIFPSSISLDFSFFPLQPLSNAERLLIVISTILFFAAAAAEDTKVKSDDQIAADLGILVGEGEGVTETYLNKPTTRIQSVILFLRLKGLESEAIAFKGTANFDDAKLVWDKGQTILAYIKANPQLGWLGIGDNTFDPLSTITAQQYYKCCLKRWAIKKVLIITMQMYSNLLLSMVYSAWRMRNRLRMQMLQQLPLKH